MKGRKVALATIALAVSGAALISCTFSARCTQCFLRNAKFVYTVGDSTVGAFTVDATTGQVTTVAGSPFAVNPGTDSCPDLAAADRAGKFLFVPDACNDNIVVFSIDANSGSLTAIPGSPFPTGTENFDVQQPVVTPSGKFLYVPEDSAGQVLGFQIGLDGALTRISGSPFPAQGQNETLAMGPLGRFLYAADGNTPGTITVFSIDFDTGSLSPITGSPFAVGATPKFMAIHPSGKFLYATAPDTDTVLGFNIDPISGGLTPMAGSPFSAGPNPQGVDATVNGRFLFVANNADIESETTGNVSAYVINGITGALTAVPNSPFKAGPNPKRIAAESSCRFVYVTNEDSNNMTVFAIDPNTGALTGIPGSPFATNVGSEGITIIRD